MPNVFRYVISTNIGEAVQIFRSSAVGVGQPTEEQILAQTLTYKAKNKRNSQTDDNVWTFNIILEKVLLQLKTLAEMLIIFTLNLVD